jgi:hypothetical protein
VEVNEVKFDEEGNFSILSGTSGILFGKGLGLGRKLGIGDVDKLLGMLGNLSDIEVNVDFEDGKMQISGGKSLVYGYRLTGLEYIKNDILDEKVKENLLGEWSEGDFGIEELQEIKKLFVVLESDEIKEVQGNLTFLSEEGMLKVRVGNRNRNSGQIVLGEMSLDSEYMFWVAKINKLINVLDESKIHFAFKKGVKRILVVRMKEFTWIMGALVEEKEVKK